MKKVFIALVALLCFTGYPSFASTQQKTSLQQTESTEHTRRVQFIYGFYIAYMSSIVYDVYGLSDMLRRKYVSDSVFSPDIDADPLLDAQDCIQENIQTLNVSPVDNTWYKVSFLWPSNAPSIPDNRHVIYLRLKPVNRSYKIAEVKTEELFKSSHLNNRKI